MKQAKNYLVFGTILVSSFLPVSPILADTSSVRIGDLKRQDRVLANINNGLKPLTYSDTGKHRSGKLETVSQVQMFSPAKISSLQDAGRRKVDKAEQISEKSCKVRFIGSEQKLIKAAQNYIETQNKSNKCFDTNDARQEVVKSVTEIYREDGDSLVVIKLGDDPKKLELVVLRGAINSNTIEVVGNDRLSKSYILDRVKLGITEPFNQNVLETQLQLLKSSNPLLSKVTASLRPSSTGEENKRDLRIEVVEAPPKATLQFDNYFPPSVGAERVSFNLSYPNPTGLGDFLSASYSNSLTGGVNFYDFSYRIPLNTLDSSLHLRVSPSSNRITDPQFVSFGIRGTGEAYELTYRNPIIKNIGQGTFEELALSAGFSYQNGQTFLFNNTPIPFGLGPDQDGFSRTRVIKLGQDYLYQDTGGSWQFASTFNLGVGLFGATINEHPTPDGRFFSWLFQTKRVQQLGNNFQLIFEGALQLSPNTLLPANQFAIGGFGSVRGYRQSARFGDNGYRLSIEGQIPLQNDLDGKPVLVLAPFVEAGGVWNEAKNPNILSDQTFLPSIGMGVLMQPIQNLNLRLDYGLPLVNLRDRGSNTQESAFYFSAKYQF